MNDYEVHFDDGTSVIIQADNERQARHKASKLAIVADIEEIELLLDTDPPKYK